MKRKLIMLALIVVMAFTMMPFGSNYSYAYEREFIGKDCSKDTYAIASIDYIAAKYKIWTKWKGSGQCWGYAEKVNSLLGSSTYTVNCKKKWNKTNITKLLVGTKAGAHVRIENRQRQLYHSIVILKCTKKEVIWTDGNYDYNNGIRYTRQSFSDFVSFRNDGNTYITQIKKVKAYRHHTKPLIAAQQVNNLPAIYWTKTKGATSYKVYRASSKNGRYVQIATTKQCNYMDKKAPIGKRRYYKVVAVKGSGTVKSEIVSQIRRLDSPGNLNVSNQQNTGYITLSWDKVSGADSYKVYRYDAKKNKYLRIKTTTALSYVDKKATTVGDWYDYMVKAYEANSKSHSDGEYIYGQVGLGKTNDLQVTAFSPTDPRPILTWSKVKGATAYNIYRTAPGSEEYIWLGTQDATSECSFVDEYFMYYDWEEGKNCYFNDGKACYFVQAINDTNYWETLEGDKSDEVYYEVILEEK